MSKDEAGQDMPLSPQVRLARRLNLLLDVVEAERGRPVTFREIQKELAGRRIRLSRARWFYMKDGSDRLVRSPELLAGLCSIFGIEPAYLLDLEGTDLPDRIESQLEFVKALRAARVKSFAVRTLGDVSPGTLRAISGYLNEDIARSPVGRGPEATDPTGSEDGPPTAP
ncbi:MAG: hypothetical protein JWP57_4047 [Spirosoma sp.]|nr:hypothetical protein [Spirosoma sp.]